MNLKFGICIIWILGVARFASTLAGDYREDEYPSDETELNEYGGATEESECPPGWREYGDYCYLYAQTGRQWTQAERECQVAAEGAHLASVITKEELEFIFALIKVAGTHWLHREHQAYHSYAASNDFVWLGLAFLCPNGDSRWTDGSKHNESIQVFNSTRTTASYTSRTYSATTRGQQRCVAFYMGMDGGRLQKQYCLDYAPYVCKMIKESKKDNDTRLITDDEEGDQQCGGHDWCYHNNSCYKILTKEQSWFESRSACMADGGDLVSIHSILELDYLNNNLTVDFNAGNTFWTGLNKLDTVDDKFQWSDNTPIDFVPAIANEATRVGSPQGAVASLRNPSCVSLKVSLLRRVLAKSPAAGRMRDNELQFSRCDTSRAAVCRRLLVTATLAPAKAIPSDKANGGCPTGWMAFRNRCYKSFGITNETFSERASFREAQQNCSKYKANLVSVQDSMDNNFLLSQMTNGELNQTWLGLIYNEGKLKWIDETEVRYTNFDAIGMAMFGWNRAGTSASSGLTTTPASIYRHYDYYGSYSSSLWRQQEKCFVMSLDKTPGMWDPVSSSGGLSSLLTRGDSSASSITRWRRSMYWSYDWHRSMLAEGGSCERLKLPYVCEKSKSRNESGGEKEWLCDDEGDTSMYKHGSNCYEVVLDTPMTWSEARQYCEKSSATLTSILDQQEYAFFLSLTKKLEGDLDAFWIGMRVVSHENSTGLVGEWVDEWPVWITRWGTKEPTKDEDHECVMMTGNSPGVSDLRMSWAQESCEKKLPFVCKHMKGDETPPTRHKEGHCDPGWLKGSTQCYFVNQIDWTDGANAMLRCWRKYNASLASFPTEADWTIITGAEKLKEVKRGFFIGLMQKIHGGFEWVDGNPLDFTNWAPGEPRFGSNPSLEVCVEMDQKGMWHDAGCHEIRHFICSRPLIEEDDGAPSSKSHPLPAVVVPKSSTSTLMPPSKSKTTPAQRQPSTTTSSSPIDSSSPSTFANNSRSINSSSSSNDLQSGRSSSSSSKSGSSSKPGVIAGIVICVLFLLIMATLGIVYFYRQHTQGSGILPNLFNRGGNDTMRFEILNERNDEY